MNSKDQLVLKKIQQHIESVLRYCQGLHSFQQFQSDSMLVEATVFNLMQIGELAKASLSDEAGAALCIAGLATDGITIVDDIVYIQRGYERFEEKIRGIGGIIERVSTEREIQKFKLKVS